MAKTTAPETVRELKLYKGRPVKHMRKTEDGSGILLIFWHPRKGQPGARLTITQEDWDKFGVSYYFNPDEEYPDVRKLASAWRQTPKK